MYRLVLLCAALYGNTRKHGGFSPSHAKKQIGVEAVLALLIEVALMGGTTHARCTTLSFFPSDFQSLSFCGTGPGSQ